MFHRSKVITGIIVLTAVGALLGLLSNALRADGLPMVRKPLSETRATADLGQLLSDEPPVTESQPPDESPDPEEAKEEEPEKVSATADEVKTEEPAKVARPADNAAPKKSSDPIKKPDEAREKPIQALFTTIEDAKACYDRKDAIFLDARMAEDYEMEHIAGALLLSFESIDDNYDRTLGNTPKNRLLITYCSDLECSSATKLADELVARGHTRVFIMIEGLPGWIDAGYKTSYGKAP